MIRQIASISILLVMLGVSPARAQMRGMGSGMGSGMLVLADDGSLLVTRITGGMMSSQQRLLVNIGASGNERWRLSFTSGWPMMPATKKSLVVFALVDDWWMGGGGDNHVTIQAVDLAAGTTKWKVTLDGQMASYPQFSRNGSRIYVAIGDYSGTYTMMGKRVVALDLSGKVLWSVDLNSTAEMERIDE